MKRIVIALVALWFILSTAWAQSPPPNVMLIVADDFGDYELQDPSIDRPTLDALASISARFSSVYGSANCSPFREWVQHGTYPWRFGFGTIMNAANVNTNPNTNPSAPLFPQSIAEMTKSLGYSTAHFGKDHTHNNHSPELQALLVDANDALRQDGYDTRRAGTTYGFGGPGQSYTNWQRVDDGVVTTATSYNTRVIANEVIGWLGEPAQQSGPWFAWVGFNAPHEPFHVPPAAALPPGYQVPANPTDRQKYSLAITAMDFQLSRIFAALPPNTWVIFVGDNGTPPGAAVLPLNPNKVKGSVWNGGVSPPLMVYGPWVTPGDYPHVVSCGDLWSSIADLVGYLGSRPADSISILDTVFRAPNARTYAPSIFREPNGAGPYTEIKVRMSSAAGSLMVEDPDGHGPIKAVVRLVNTVTEAPIVDPALEAVLMTELDVLGLLQDVTF